MEAFSFTRDARVDLLGGLSPALLNRLKFSAAKAMHTGVIYTRVACCLPVYMHVVVEHVATFASSKMNECMRLQ